MFFNKLTSSVPAPLILSLSTSASCVQFPDFPPSDVTAETEISQTVRASGRAFAGKVKIVNHSVYRLKAPLWFIAKSLNTGAVLSNATGKTPDGDPFVAVPGTLNPDESVTLRVRFTSSSVRAPSYAPAVYSGGW